MKRKIAVTLLSAVFTLAGAAGISACAKPGGSGDKSAQNADFVTYRKKVVSVLKDNGIFVNDFDVGEEKTAQGKTNAVTASYPEHSSVIQQIIMSGNPQEDYEGAKNDRDSIFEQTFYLSLVIGDAISNYYNEKNLYGITVYFEEWNQYFEILKNGDNDIVQCYSPSVGGQSESVITLELEYKNATDYSFTCMQIWDNQQIYCYGNSAKEYFLVCRDTGVDNNNFIRYMPAENTGYFCDSLEAVNACYELIKDSIKAVDQAPIKAIKDEVKYSLTPEQSQNTLDKYFKNTGSGGVERHGVEYSEINGKKVAIGYFAKGENRIEIPGDVQYISNRFTVEDNEGTVTELYIPASVKAVINMENGETAPSSEFYLDVYDIKANNLKILTGVTVENGSTLFMPGTGHLKSPEGEYVYFSNCPLDEFTTDMVTDKLLNALHEGNYSRLFTNITELTLNLCEDVIKMNAVYEYVLPAMQSLTTLNLYGDFTRYTNIDTVRIELNNSVVVNCEFECNWNQYDRSPAPALAFIRNRGNSATVNLKGLSRVDAVNSDGATVIVNSDAPEYLYTALSVPLPSTDENVTVNFSNDGLTPEQVDIFTFKPNTRSDGINLTAVLNYNISEVTATVPDKLGVTVNALEIRNTLANRIELNPSLKYILIEDENHERAITLKYNGTKEQFERDIQIICYVDNYTYTLEYDGGSEIISGMFNVPDEELCTVTVNFGGETLVFDHIRKNNELNLDIILDGEAVKGLLEDGATYAWLGDDSSVTPVYHDVYYTDLGKVTPAGDTAYTLVKLKAEPDGTQLINIDNGEISGTLIINWLSGYAYTESGLLYKGDTYFQSDNIKLTQENIFYCDSKDNDPVTGEPVGQKKLTVKFKIIVDADGYLTAETDTVTEGYDG